MQMIYALAIDAVTVIVRRAVEGINVNKQGQTLEIKGTDSTSSGDPLSRLLPPEGPETEKKSTRHIWCDS
jgi:hypothetical protein